ncbi:sugar transferase [Lactiplantibacillus plantarum]|nr:sugar transferase [Lactiplantibacillus plantarum]
MKAGSQHGRVQEYLDMKNVKDASSKHGEQILNQEDIDSRLVYRFFKKFIDKSLSLIAIIILSPIFLLISLLIKHEDNGPVFYVQKRVGRNGKLFNIYKFRSMIVNADQKIDKLVEKNEIDGAMFKIKNDPRITGVGKFLRKYSLDELPQLLNVLRGDMSLVGPRPPLEREVQKYTKYDMQRLMVTPGCSGLWQVSGRNDLSFEEMVQLDIDYIKQSSLHFDVWIMARTVFIMIRPNSAY